MCVVVLGIILTAVLLLVNNRQWEGAKMFAMGGAVVHFISWVVYGDERTKAEAYLRELLDK
jgi:hypothetical protein